MAIYKCSRVVTTSEQYHQAEAASYVEREKQWSGEFVCMCVCLFCLLYYYWLVFEDIYGVGVFADGRSDVLEKWRSGIRQR
jgi:hypothetical protein